MLLTISTTHQPATDLGYLLHKHPDKLQTFDLSFGKAHVYYPEATVERCTAALQLEIDPIGLVRGIKSRGKQRSLQHYVNDRPYVASSFLSVAINKVFRSAFAGRGGGKQELAATRMPLEATVHCLRNRGDDSLLLRLFQPLGYEVSIQPHPLDSKFDDWGNSPYFTITIKGSRRLSDLLRHLYVLIPVFDNEKHYWVGDDEVEKLLRQGENWLESHPEKALIASRYLKSQRSLARAALEQLTVEDGDSETVEKHRLDSEQVLEAPLRLNERRLRAIVEAVKATRASNVVDLGCGEGKLIKELLEIRELERILGFDVSSTALEIAERRLRLHGTTLGTRASRPRRGRDALVPSVFPAASAAETGGESLQEMPDNQRRRIKLMHGSLTYRDTRLNGFDVAVAAEVIEHIDLDRLGAFERAVFEFSRPGAVILTTPNAEYNANFKGMKPGQMRHPDHRFEWTRAEFQAWCSHVCGKYSYGVEHKGVGDAHPDLGPPTQMAVFKTA